jgi:ATP-dependent Lon protease
MNSKLTLEQVNSLILFQRRYRFLKSEINDINSQLSFYQDSLMSMLSNLVSCNKINIYAGTNASFMIILDELKEINDLLKSVPNKISIRDLRDTNIKNINLTLFKVYKLLIRYSNHVSFENFNYILELFGGKNWISYFDEEDIEKLLFISRFFKPICIWDSEEHKDKIPIPNKTEPKKKNAVMAKDLLESLLGGNSNNKVSSIIVGDNSMPAFLKSINELIQTSPKKGRSRDNNFNKIECIGILDRDNIKITKNSKSASLFEDKFGACVYLKLDSKYLVVQGIFKDDVLNISRNIPFVEAKFKDHKSAMAYNLYDVPKTFKNNYLKIINLRDLVGCTTNELCEELKKKFHDFKGIQGKPLLSLINEFLLASKYRKVDILTLLLMSNEDDQKLAYVLYDVLKSKDKKNIAGEIYESLHYSIRELLESSQKMIEEDETKLEKLSSSDIPYERRISLMKTDDEVKTKAMEKLKSMKSSFQGDNKAQSWLDGLLKIPFGTYSKNDILEFKGEFMKKIKLQYPESELESDIQITNFLENAKEEDIGKMKQEWEDYLEERTGYLKSVRSKLDEAVYGHKEAKTQLERIFAQWINGEAKGAVLGLQGPPGTGKTSLAKNGLSKCLVDKNGEPRPFAFLPIGGSVNGSTLVGHNFTYVGSTWGRIVDVCISSKCMNPIIFIDEIDKVSQTEHGREIISILTHLTDGTQNDEFEDKYFAGIKLDLSKALIVFSFNDVSLIDPILRDRITIIETNPLTLPEKVHIIQNYMLPEILKEVGLNKDEIELSPEMIEFLISTYTNEAGVRKIKEKIQEIVRDVNLNRFHDMEKYEIPFVVTEEYIKVLFENKPKVRVKKIADEPSVGLVNGLYATVSGIGGLTIIQVMKYPADKMLELSMTGKQGDVMKESVNYASKIAFSLLSKEEQDKLIADGHDKKGFGLHVHTPEAATPKDGPSAGAAMTLAIYSILTGKRVNNKVAMTGEIDLCKRVTAIGGVDAKLNGAKRAGVTKALVPKENEEDVDKMRRDGLSPEDDTFEIVFIDHIDQVLEHALVD